MRTVLPCGVLALALAIAGCGTTGDAGGGDSNLPVSGAGPYKSLEPDETIDRITPPVVYLDPTADLDDPFVIADGEQLELWVTARRKSGTTIDHAGATRLTDGFESEGVALTADQPWEGGEVTGPSLIRGRGSDPWLMFYGAAGAIGWAISTDGVTWDKGPGPTLSANGAEEGTRLGAPGAVRIGDRVRVYYAAGDVLWAAEAPLGDLAAGQGGVIWNRLDGDLETAARDPMVGAIPYGVGLGRVFARADATPAGRVRHDLYFSVAATVGTGNSPGLPTIGFAASFTGERFEVAPGSVMPKEGSARGPAMTPYGAGAVLLYVARAGARDAISAALSP